MTQHAQPSVWIEKITQILQCIYYKSIFSPKCIFYPILPIPKLFHSFSVEHKIRYLELFLPIQWSVGFKTTLEPRDFHWIDQSKLNNNKKHIYMLLRFFIFGWTINLIIQIEMLSHFLDALSCICKFSHCSDALRQLMRLPVVKYEINSKTRQLVMLMNNKRWWCMFCI